MTFVIVFFVAFASVLRVNALRRPAFYVLYKIAENAHNSSLYHSSTHFNGLLKAKQKSCFRYKNKQLTLWRTDQLEKRRASRTTVKRMQRQALPIWWNYYSLVPFFVTKLLVLVQYSTRFASLICTVACSDNGYLLCKYRKRNFKLWIFVSVRFQYQDSVFWFFELIVRWLHHCSILVIYPFELKKRSRAQRYWTRTTIEQKHILSSWFGTTPPHPSWRRGSRRWVPRSSIAWIEWLPINRKLVVLFWSSLRRRAYPRPFLPSKVLLRTPAWCESSSSNSSNDKK